VNRHLQAFRNRLLPLLVVLALLAWQHFHSTAEFDPGSSGAVNGGVEAAFTEQRGGRWPGVAPAGG
jgi:hypothetical protein